MPSDIPYAREILSEIVFDKDTPPILGERIFYAMGFMTRDSAVRKARVQMPPLTYKMKSKIHQLAKDRNLSCADIAVRVGLPPCASGRVSEVLHGLR